MRKQSGSAGATHTPKPKEGEASEATMMSSQVRVRSPSIQGSNIVISVSSPKLACDGRIAEASFLRASAYTSCRHEETGRDKSANQGRCPRMACSSVTVIRTRSCVSRKHIPVKSSGIFAKEGASRSPSCKSTPMTVQFAASSMSLPRWAWTPACAAAASLSRIGPQPVTCAPA